jgi:hypothetical protein
MDMDKVCSTKKLKKNKKAKVCDATMLNSSTRLSTKKTQLLKLRFFDYPHIKALERFD